MFARYIGIDYSGAETPVSSLKGLRVYSCLRDSEPSEVPPPPSFKKYWTRQGVAHWLAEELRNGEPALVGIDHSFSFPVAYFMKYDLPPDWRNFLEDFRHFWQTDDKSMYVCFVREGYHGNGAQRSGNPKWRRLAEIRSRARSVFHFEGKGTVAYSTHAGLPWLLFLAKNLGDKAHFWPYDGWNVSGTRSVVAEAYPSLYRHRYANGDRDNDQHDAYSIAAWLRDSDRDGSLAAHFEPGLTDEELRIARYEGWILGVGAEPAVRRAAREAPALPRV